MSSNQNEAALTGQLDLSGQIQVPNKVKVKLTNTDSIVVYNPKYSININLKKITTNLEGVIGHFTQIATAINSRFRVRTEKNFLFLDFTDAAAHDAFLNSGHLDLQLKVNTNRAMIFQRGVRNPPTTIR